MKSEMEQVLKSGIIHSYRGETADTKIKRCNTFLDTLQTKEAYFQYKEGKL